MRKPVMMVALLAPILVLTACNTTRGIGRDVRSVGDAIERAPD